MSIGVNRKKPRQSSRLSLEQIVDHWRDNYQAVFPDLPVAWLGWGEPFCFRCGWLVPMPDTFGGPWSEATGWLERAHLHDVCTGGSDIAANVVPLCIPCHRGMPEFPDSAEPAIEWVRAQKHSSCPRWWQTRTDHRWNGDKRPDRCPGRMVIVNYYVSASQENQRAEDAARAVEAGDLATAAQLMILAGFSTETANRLIARYAADRACELAAS